MSYIDSYGLVRMNPWQETENGILFRAYLEWFKLLNKKSTPMLEMYEPIDATMYKTSLGELRFQANPPQRGDHFSRDNMWGLYCMALMTAPVILDDLPIMRWNDRTWWHPNGWMVFLSLKSKTWHRLFYIPILLMIAASRWKHRDDKESSGACLWAMMCYFLYGWKPTEVELAKFEYYCTNGFNWHVPDNPILIEVEGYRSSEDYELH